ncbi:MAG TPA: hypothetical protein EYG97_04690 [Arcobacter sp.]|nr:hypothetical protein [Arcobacter sp.]HIP56304.1 hypothetical protein [Arcobacter sp.]
MKEIINNIFNSINYYNDKKLLLSAIPFDAYSNKSLMIRLLGISSGMVDANNEAKKDMWNHQLHQYNMGDDILKNVSPELLDNLEFAQEAIVKYNRTYLYLSQRLKASRNLALVTVSKETDNFTQNEPILKYMPESFKNDREISIIATTRNIDNLQYAPILQNNKYFILDVINLIFEDEIRYKVLRYMNQEFLEDKRFMSKLGCFDGLCEKFRGDETFVSYSVVNNIDILDKIEIFSEKILTSAFKSKGYTEDHEHVLRKIFRYIEKFNDDMDELNRKIKNKSLLNTLFWDLAQLASDEFI